LTTYRSWGSLSGHLGCMFVEKNLIEITKRKEEKVVSEDL
jgi:hypothetical protein